MRTIRVVTTNILYLIVAGIIDELSHVFVFPKKIH